MNPEQPSEKELPPVEYTLPFMIKQKMGVNLVTAAFAPFIIAAIACFLQSYLNASDTLPIIIGCATTYLLFFILLQSSQIIIQDEGIQFDSLFSHKFLLYRDIQSLSLYQRFTVGRSHQYGLAIRTTKSTKLFSFWLYPSYIQLVLLSAMRSHNPNIQCSAHVEEFLQKRKMDFSLYSSLPFRWL